MEIKTWTLTAGFDNSVTWTKLNENILEEQIDPFIDVVQTSLIIFLGLSQDEVINGLTTDTLSQSEVSVYLTCVPTEATCQLSNFNFVGTSVNIQEYFTEDWGGTWLVVLSDGSIQGTQSLVFLEPSSTSQTTAEIDSSTATLNIQADLHSLTPVVIEPLITDITINWSGLTRTGVGTELDIYRLDRLMVARFDEKASKLETDFKNLESLSEEMWETNVEGVTSIKLSTLVGNSTFNGIDSRGIYLLGLFCTSCSNPMPSVLTFLSPSSEK